MVCGGCVVNHVSTTAVLADSYGPFACSVMWCCRVSLSGWNHHVAVCYTVEIKVCNVAVFAC